MLLTVTEFKVVEDGGYFLIPIEKHDRPNNAIGDQIGYDETHLWIYDSIDIDDREIKEFLKDNFNNYRAICGFIRRITE